MASIANRPLTGTRTGVEFLGFLCGILFLLFSLQSSLAFEKRVLLLRATFVDQPTEPVSYSVAQMMADKDIEPFFRDMSFGVVPFEMTVSTQVFALPKTSGDYAADHRLILNDATQAAAPFYDLSKFTDIGVVFPQLPLPWAGWGQRGAPGYFMINGKINFHPFVVSHEIGHTYKLGHANLFQSSISSPIGPGTIVEYGDFFDLMGYGPPGRGHFGPRWKYQLGWLKDSHVLQPTATGRYRLYCFDNPAASVSNKLAVKIPRRDGRVYWIGLRGQYLADSRYTKGLYVTLDSNTIDNSSTLIDMIPGGTGLDAPLAENATFIDSEEGFQITPGTIQGTGLGSYVDIQIVITRPSRAIELWGPSTWGQNVPPVVTEDLIDVAIGFKQSLGLRSDGSVVQWGTPYLNIPPPTGLRDVVRVAASEIFCLALKADGRVEHWGHSFGQTIESETNVIEIAAGSYHAVALRANGTVGVHGSNEAGQRNVPAGLKDVVAISAGQWHSLALRRDGTLVAWGRNIWGQSTIPAGLSGVIAIASQSNSNLALKSDGTIVQWGYADFPQPPALEKVKRIAAGHYWGLAQLESGEMVAWGENIYGQTTVPFVEPNRIRSFSAGGENGAILVGNAAENRFHAWRIRNRISAFQPLDDDSDSDGQTLLEEYAFNRNPGVADFHTPLTLQTSPGDGVSFSYRVSALAVDVSVQLEVSSDLVTWTPVDAEAIGVEEGYQRFRYRHGSGSSNLFGRLRFEPK